MLQYPLHATFNICLWLSNKAFAAKLRVKFFSYSCTRKAENRENRHVYRAIIYTGYIHILFYNTYFIQWYYSSMIPYIYLSWKINSHILHYFKMRFKFKTFRRRLFYYKIYGNLKFFQNITKEAALQCSKYYKWVVIYPTSRYDLEYTENQDILVMSVIQSFSSAIAVKAVGYCLSHDRLQDTTPVNVNNVAHNR